MVAAVSGQELQGEDVTREDHPLSLDHGSRWHTYFKDNEIIQQVRKEGPAQPIYIYICLCCVGRTASGTHPCLGVSKAKRVLFGEAFTAHRWHVFFFFRKH